MKRLLKILSVLTLTTVPVTSVVACGGASVPVNPTDDGVDIKDLLIKLQDKIKEGFGNLIDEGKNLFSEGQFAEGENYHDVLNNLPSETLGDGVEITEDDFINTFIQRIQSLINESVVPKLLADSDLRLLFNGIPTNNILKIVNTNTKFFKAPFKWTKEDVDFGIIGYSPGNYNIEYWYKIGMNLNLEVSYKDAENKEQKKDFIQNYISYFANTNANISAIIEASSLLIKEKLQNHLIDINLTKDEDNSNDKRIKMAQDNILKIINSNKLEIKSAIFIEGSNTKITSSSLIIPNYSFYSEANKFYNACKVSKDASITYLKDYFEKRIVKNFDRKLDEWVNNSDLNQEAKVSIRKNKEKINAFGKIELNNWTISGLTLKNIKLNFTNSRTDETKTQWATFMSQTLGRIFSIDGWLKIPFNIINNDGNLTMYMNKTDFETYVQENKNLQNVSDYFSEKIQTKAIREQVINNNTQFRITLNGAYSNFATITNSAFVTKIDDDTFKVIKNPSNYFSYINIIVDGFHFILGGKKYGENYITFKNWIIKKADSTIWQ